MVAYMVVESVQVDAGGISQIPRSIGEQTCQDHRWVQLRLTTHRYRCITSAEHRNSANILLTEATLIPKHAIASHAL